MGVMVLNRNFWLLQSKRVLGGQIIRVHIVGHDFRLQVEQSFKMLDAFSERGQRGIIFQVADVGVVTDILDFLPELAEAIEEAK